MTTRISPGQLFCLLSLFMLGSAWLFALGGEAKQDAWLVSLLGMAAGLPLMGLYLLLQSQFPRQTLVQYLPRIIGRWAGKALALCYILYFLYIGARVTRDFAELLLLVLLPRTPMSVVAITLVAMCAYGVRHGPEVLARTAQVLYPVGVGLIMLATVLAMGDFRLQRITPIMEEGWRRVWQVAFPLTVSVPFGETVVFGMLWPIVARSRTRWSLAAGVVSGLFLAYLSLVYVGVMGAHVVGTSHFPLLQLVQQIRVTDLFERLDALVVVVLVLGGFMKIALFYYGAVAGMAQWVGVADYRPLVLPMGTMLVALTFLIASSYAEHIQIGLKEVPRTLHVPVQMVVPVLLLVVHMAKARLAH